jgi:hypothetical protein
MTVIAAVRADKSLSDNRRAIAPPDDSQGILLTQSYIGMAGSDRSPIGD